MNRVLVCGGRDFADKSRVWRVLDKLHALHPIDVLIVGGASGADHLAEQWAKHHQIAHFVFPAQWRRLPLRAAGPVRNRRMLDEGKPDRVVAFPGGTGTENMVTQAKNAGLPVIRIKP